MQTIVQVPEGSTPSTIREIVAALNEQLLEATHEVKNWGDWIHFTGCQTVISIESMRGLATTATIEHAEDERIDPTVAILKAFHQVGWVGLDEDGEYPLG